METLVIEDLHRNEELTAEEMRTIEGGFSTSFSAISEVLKNFGDALHTAARGG